MSQHEPALTSFLREDLRARVEHFAGGSLSLGVKGARNRSYDHCYNYFMATPLPTADMEKSCAVLGFYLASWGMYRGSTHISRETNSSLFVPLVNYIEAHGVALRSIDVDSYNTSTIRQICDAFAAVSALVLPDGQTAVTLTTKIMLGVFGCVPAYDTYFIGGMRTVFRGQRKASFWQMSPRSLELLAQLYVDNQRAIDDLAATSKTFRFAETSPTGLPLTKAKIIDMYGFDLGYYPSAVA
jgi:hypothetical protein